MSTIEQSVKKDTTQVPPRQEWRVAHRCAPCEEIRPNNVICPVCGHRLQEVRALYKLRVVPKDRSGRITWQVVPESWAEIE